MFGQKLQVFNFINRNRYGAVFLFLIFVTVFFLSIILASQTNFNI